jgi:hypothetical protein
VIRFDNISKQHGPQVLFIALVDRFGRVQARFDELGGYALEAKAREIMAGLGFSQEMMDGVSGGWKMRVTLARILLMRPKCLGNSKHVFACLSWSRNPRLRVVHGVNRSGDRAKRPENQPPRGQTGRARGLTGDIPTWA